MSTTKKLSTNPRAIARRKARAVVRKKSSKAARPIHDHEVIDGRVMPAIKEQRNPRALELSLETTIEMMRAENARLKQEAEKLQQEVQRQVYGVGCIETGRVVNLTEAATPEQPDETRVGIATNGLMACNRRLRTLCESLDRIAERQLGPVDQGPGVCGPCLAGTLGQLDGQVSTFGALLDVLDATTARLAQV